MLSTLIKWKILDKDICLIKYGHWQNTSSFNREEKSYILNGAFENDIKNLFIKSQLKYSGVKLNLNNSFESLTLISSK